MPLGYEIVITYHLMCHFIAALYYFMSKYSYYYIFFTCCFIISCENIVSIIIILHVEIVIIFDFIGLFGVDATTIYIRSPKISLSIGIYLFRGRKRP
jgi:hypothetical protein